MVKLGLAFAMLAACGDPAATADAGDPNDLDGDGIANADDNCPRNTNANQHDEDGDGVGDVCDNCPSIANANQSDLTEQGLMQFPDGVGDACDLRLALAGDKLAAFFPFATDAEAMAFRGSGWAIASDVLHTDATATWGSVRSAPGLGIAAEALVASIAWNDPAGSFTVGVDGDGITGGTACTISADRDADGADEIDLTELGAATAHASLDAAITAGKPLAVTTWRVIDTLHQTGKVTCIVKYAGATKTLMIATADDVWVGTYGIAATMATVDTSSLAIYTSPLPPSKNN
jgi:hypothetical protein